MDQENILGRIEAFWEWFRVNEFMFREVTDVDEAREAMDNQILEFGMFSWSVSEGSSKPYSFTVSPNGDSKRLIISHKIMQEAPPMPDWEFHYCKPPQDWDFSIEMYDQFMLKQQYDVSEWEYVLRQHPGENIEVIVCAKNLTALQMDDRLDAGEMALTKILGEELVIDHLCALEVLDEFDQEHKPFGRKMCHLRQDFESSLNQP